MDTLIEDHDYHISEYPTFRVLLRRRQHDEHTLRMEITGYRLLLPEESRNPDQPAFSGHDWKGINGPVNGYRARFEMGLAHAHVSDDVLAIYENDESYQVYPHSGSVRYASQWSVGHCERVGRNAIKVELKKLYEGTPYEVIDHWNKFSIDPDGINTSAENIEQKASRLIRNYFLFARLTSALFNKLINTTFTAMDVVNIDQEHMQQTGWQEFPLYDAIAAHVPASKFSKDQFLARCKKLYMLLGENLVQRNIRTLVKQLGFPNTETSAMGSIRLLELIIKYLKLAEESGLDPLNDRQAIIDRIAELKDYQSIPELIELNAIRQLDAHHSSDSRTKLYNSLKIFGINANALSNNYATATDQVYDRLAEMFSHLNFWLSGIDLN